MKMGSGVSPLATRPSPLFQVRDFVGVLQAFLIAQSPNLQSPISSLMTRRTYE